MGLGLIVVVVIGQAKACPLASSCYSHGWNELQDLSAAAMPRGTPDPTVTVSCGGAHPRALPPDVAAVEIRETGGSRLWQWYRRSGFALPLLAADRSAR